MDKIKHAFTEHPASVGESWSEHAQVALGFALRLQVAALAAFVHALLPFLCVKTSSGIITRLYERMVTNRNRQTAAITDTARA